MPKTLYSHLLLAIDFEPASEAVIERARQLRDRLGARLTLLHVVEDVPPAIDYLPMGASGEILTPGNAELEEELLELARIEMKRLGERLGVEPPERLIRVGPTGRVIEAVADELGVDLVIVGSHGRHGLLGLFGSTARQVLRDPERDVLCVKLHQLSQPEGGDS